MNTLILAVIIMAGVGLVLGIVIGIFAKLFRVETDPRIDLVVELLPGANCGGCGMAGCSDFAKAVVSGKAAPSKCPVSSSEQVSAIAKALGIEAGEAFKQKAVVVCGGDREQTLRLAGYNGVADCVSASLVAGGPKGCAYGCLGMGSCARKCPFGAIEMINGLAVVHKELCVGCGSCVAVCPRNVIKLVPADADENSEDLEVSILRAVEENGEQLLETIDDDQELEDVYQALMDLMYEDEDAEGDTEN